MTFISSNPPLNSPAGSVPKDGKKFVEAIENLTVEKINDSKLLAEYLKSISKNLTQDSIDVKVSLKQKSNLADAYRQATS